MASIFLLVNVFRQFPWIGADLIVFQCHVNICITSSDLVHTACSCFLKYGVSAFREGRREGRLCSVFRYSLMRDIFNL